MKKLFNCQGMKTFLSIQRAFATYSPLKIIIDGFMRFCGEEENLSKIQSYISLIEGATIFYYPENKQGEIRNFLQALKYKIQEYIEMGTIKTLALCAGRHEMPSDCTGAIFANEINPLDVDGMEEQAKAALKDVNNLILYVTGLSVALAAVIKVCFKNNIGLVLLHYDRVSGEYYEQEIRDYDCSKNTVKHYQELSDEERRIMLNEYFKSLHI